MQLDEPADEREAEPHPTLRAVQCLSALGEDLEDLRQQLWLDSLTVVADAKLRLLADAVERNLDLAACLGVLDRVLEQIGDDLLEAHGIAVDEERSAAEMNEMARGL